MPEWVITLLRSTGLFLLALFLVRLMGKRSTSSLTFFDFVTVIVIGVIIATLSLNLIPNGINGLVTLAVWTIFPALVYLLSIKYKAVRDIVHYKETVLINHGKILEDKLMKVRYTPEDLLSALRKKNIFNIDNVEFAVMEPTGDVSVLLKKGKQPITAKTTGMPVGMESVPQTVMLDGIIMDEALTAMGLNRQWLHTELEKVGVAPENVFIGQVDSGGQLYIDLFDDAVIVPAPKTKELAYVTLRKAQSDCEAYALATIDQDTKGMFANSAKILLEVANELEPWLKQ